jgi:hypothetical protein
MYFELYYDSTNEILETEENKGFKEALELLKKLKEEGKIEIEFIDTSKISDEKRMDVYSKVAALAAIQKYRIRQIFGSRRKSGVFFGKEVPALLVYKEKGGLLQDICPREERGKIITIKNFLENLK